MLDLGMDWNYYDFNYSIVELADRLDPGNCNADEFDLSLFEARGGKLIMYQGYADALIPTGSSVLFYKEVLKTLKPKGIDLDPFFRHFLVPGMQHCAGTPPDVNAPWFFAGPNQAGSLSEKPGSMHSVLGFRDPKHDILLALMEWTEKRHRAGQHRGDQVEERYSVRRGMEAATDLSVSEASEICW